MGKVGGGRGVCSSKRSHPHHQKVLLQEFLVEGRFIPDRENGETIANFLPAMFGLRAPEGRQGIHDWHTTAARPPKAVVGQ